MNNENEPRQTSWLAFRDALDGPPTYWVPPCVSPSPIPSSSEDDPSIPLERRGAMASASAVRLRTSTRAGDFGDRAHIPQGRGGAPGHVFACGWEEFEIARGEVVVVERERIRARLTVSRA